MDTNVPIVANGRPDPAHGSRAPSIACRIAAVERLMALIEHGTVVLDVDGQIQAEYQRHLNPRGQPGVGDRFYELIINSHPGRVERVALPLSSDGNYSDFPPDPALAGFDRSDRKFAALSRRETIPVVTATDSDWLHLRGALELNGIKIDFVCGCDQDDWYVR